MTKGFSVVLCVWLHVEGRRVGGRGGGGGVVCECLFVSCVLWDVFISI